MFSTECNRSFLSIVEPHMRSVVYLVAGYSVTRVLNILPSSRTPVMNCGDL